jgi:hypothetical protein
LKIILQEPRPFWLDDRITAYDCESGYGYPSNHVLTTVPSYFFFFEILYYHFKLDKTVNANLFYWIGISIVGMICASIGFGRMILGVHSWDQVFFALLIGFASYYFYLHIIDYDIKNYHPFLNQISNKFYTARMMVIIISIYLFFLIQMFFIDFRDETIWRLRIIKNCGSLPVYPVYFKNLSESGEYFTLFGMLIGILYDVLFNYKNEFNTTKIPLEYVYENINDNIMVFQHTEISRTGKWNDTSILISITRIIILNISNRFIFYLSLVPYLINQSDNLIAIFLFQVMIPSLFSGIFLFGFGRKFCFYLNLSNLSINNK